MLATLLVDTHCHICDAAFDADRSAVLAHARQAGVGAVVAVGEDMADARRNLDLADKFSMLKPAAGLYPAHADMLRAQELAVFIRQHRDRLWAIGEVGLDFWIAKEEAERELQREVLKMFIDLADALDLPLNVHSRSAGRHVVDLLMKSSARRVQLHAFDAKAGTARPAVEAGFFFSIPPSVVRSRQKQKLVRALPLSCLLAETDSPVLGPRVDERNVPGHLPLVIRAVAELKGVAEEAVAAAVAENTERLYGDMV